MVDFAKPKKFTSVKALQEAITEYFDDPPLRSVFSAGVEIEVPFLSITGLALHLGFASRQSIYDYEKIAKYSYTIKRARLLIENEYEKQLQCGNYTAAIFALKNFGWSDKIEQEITTNTDEVVKSINVKIVGPAD